MPQIASQALLFLGGLVSGIVLRSYVTVNPFAKRDEKTSGNTKKKAAAAAA